MVAGPQRDYGPVLQSAGLDSVGLASAVGDWVDPYDQRLFCSNWHSSKPSATVSSGMGQRPGGSAVVRGDVMRMAIATSARRAQRMSRRGVSPTNQQDSGGTPRSSVAFQIIWGLGLRTPASSL